MSDTLDDVLDQLDAIITAAMAIQEKTGSSQLNDKILELSWWWRFFNHKRAGQTGDAINEAKASLEVITKDLDAQKEKLGDVAKTIASVAQAAAVMEKLAKIVA